MVTKVILLYGEEKMIDEWDDVPIRKELSIWHKVLKVNPNDDTAWLRIGNIFSRFDIARYRKAIACFDKAIEINPKNWEAWSAKGVALIIVSRYYHANACFDKAIHHRRHGRFRLHADQVTNA